MVLFGEADTPDSSLELSWDGGRLSLPIPQGDSETGQTVRLLQGSRLITDFESRYPSAEALAPLEKRKQSRIAARLAELSRTYGLASREMSLVAVVKRAGDRPGELPETRVVPVGLAQDVAYNAYFGAPQACACDADEGLPYHGRLTIRSACATAEVECCIGNGRNHEFPWRDSREVEPGGSKSGRVCPNRERRRPTHGSRIAA